MSNQPMTRAETAFDQPLLIASILQTGLNAAPEQEILNADQSRYTYRELGERVHRLANALADLGVKEGDTVAVMEWDTPRYLECFFAIPMMGAVIHTINVRLSPEQVLYTINHAKDDVILINREFLPLLEAVWDKVDTVKKLILLESSDGPAQTTLPIDGEYEALLAAASADYDFPILDENTTASTFYTTGTTGLPKGVYFSHRQLVMHTLAARSATAGVGHGRFNQDDVYMPITPMFHVHAWGVPYAATMLGVKQVYPGRYEPATLLKLLVTEKVTFSHCVPTILQMILSSEQAKAIDLSGWQVLIGGSALTAGLARAALARGIQIYTGYGMSETCPILSTTWMPLNAADSSEEEQVAVRIKTGCPVPLVNMRIIDERGRFLPHDGESMGEVVVRTPWLTQGYLHDPEQSDVLWENGWMHTGDVGTIDASYTLQIRDRIKDVIKTGGEWISSLDIENLISQHPAVELAAVVGLPDNEWGERPHALVTVRAGMAVDHAAIVSHMQRFVEQGLIEKWAIPDSVQVVDEIPRTSVGKIDKKVIRERLAK